MKTFLRAMGTFVLVLFAALASAPAMAQHGGHGYGHGYSHGYGYGGHVGFGITLGVPLYAPDFYLPYYGYPYPAYDYPYAYPPVVQSTPPVYVEQGAVQAAPAQSDWYYCAAARSYYPYVSECPGGWQRVPSQPVR